MWCGPQEHINPPSRGRHQSGGHHLARRAIQRCSSFKDDLLDKLAQIRSQSATRSGSPSAKGTSRANRLLLLKNNNKIKPSKAEYRRCPKLKDCEGNKSPGKKQSMRSFQSKENKDVNCALSFVKQLTSALRYFQDVVEKDKLEQLPGSASILLEIILSGYSELKAYLINNEQSSLIISATNQVYQSLADLIRWSDTIMLMNNNNNNNHNNITSHSNQSVEYGKSMNKEDVREIVKNVQDAVNSLVEICLDRYRSKENNNSKSHESGFKITNNFNGKMNGDLNQKKSISLSISSTCNTMRLIESHNATGSLPELSHEKAIQTNQNDIQDQNNIKEDDESFEITMSPPVQFRDMKHSLSTEFLVKGPPPKPPLPRSGRPQSITEIISNNNNSDCDSPPPLPPKNKKIILFHKNFNKNMTHSFDQIDGCSNSTSSSCLHNCNSIGNSIGNSISNSIDSIDMTSGHSNHCLSADDLLSSLTWSHARYEFEKQKLKFFDSFSEKSISSSDNLKTCSSSYSSQKSTSTTTTTTTYYNSIGFPETGTPQLGSPSHSQIQTVSRIDNLIDQMKAFNTTNKSQPEVDEPPELPVKLRSKNNISGLMNTTNNGNTNAVTSGTTNRPPSQYDNLVIDDPAETATTSQTTSECTELFNNNTNNSSFWFNNNLEQPQEQQQQTKYTHSTSCPHFSNQLNVFCAIGSSVSNVNITNNDVVDGDELDSPPPLPPKKKNIMAYMQAAGNYSGMPVDAGDFYRHSVHTYHLVQSQWQQVEMSFIQQRSIGSMIHHRSVTSSDDSVFSIGSNESLTPPLLPPKKNKHHSLILRKSHQNDSSFTSILSSKDLSPEGVSENLDIQRTSTPVSLVPSSESGISSQSGVSSQSEINSENEKPKTNQPEDEEPKHHNALDEIEVSHYLVYKGSNEDGPDIRGGPVDALIVKATEVSKNDFTFQEAFLTTYRTILSPMKLITKLLYRYNKFIRLQDAIKQQRAARNAFALLVRAVDDLCVVDCTDELMQKIMEFIYQLVNRGDLALAKVLRVKLIEKMDQREHSSHGSSILLPSIGVTVKQCSLLDFKSDHLAEQMTLLDSKLFLKIEIPEVLIWAKEQKEELIPNLNQFTEHFNKMSYWARSRILEQDDAKERERLVLKFIKIMKHLRKINNFNSYLAILSALDSAPIRRLEWQKNITETLKEYCALIDSSSSFRTYRQALADTEPPCIPYIGLILQDLTFVHIGNNDYLPDGNINFAKRWQQYNILDQMRRFKNCHYPFKRNEQMIGFFNNFDNYLSEEAMWQISESIKPRGAKK